MIEKIQDKIQDEDRHVDSEELRTKEIDTAQKDRLKLFKKVMTKWAKNEKLQRAATAVFNASIGSYITLSIEAIRGKTTIGNQELTPLGRIMNVVIVATGALSYPTVFSEQLRPVAGGLYGASWLAWLAMYGPDLAIPILQKAIENDKKPDSKISSSLQVILSWVEKSKDAWFNKKANDEDPRTNN